MKNKNNLLKVFGFFGIILFVSFLFMMTPEVASSKLNGKAFMEKYTSTQNAVLIDVRTPSEFAAGHIDRAINIDFEDVSFESLIKKLDPTKTYFIYCRSDNRSGKAALVMKNNGIKDIYDLQGGIVSNKETIQLVTTNTSSSIEYIVDSSDMLDSKTIVDSVKKAELTEAERLGLIKMREEEKLARDVYTALGAVWGSKVFSNISESEQTHTDAVKTLLEKYHIDDPAKELPVGSFASKEMQILYTDLVSRGKVSVVEAFTVGALIEDLDIHDLDILIAKTNKEDILTVYTHLQKGSRNHMRAFVKNISFQRVTYVPTYLSQKDYDAIINSPQERGR